MKALITILPVILIACGLNDPKGHYELKVGESFSFEVKANPTTPTEWRWVNQDSVKNVLLVSKTYKSDCDEDDQVAGCGGKETWTFKATAKGKTQLRVHHIYYRDEKAFDERNITIKVE